MIYKIDVDKIIELIKKNKYKRIVIQLPDGLKPYATEITKKIEEKTKVKVYIWAGSCFGRCDIPFWLKEYGFDALFHIGHFEINET